MPVISCCGLSGKENIPEGFRVKVAVCGEGRRTKEIQKLPASKLGVESPSSNMGMLEQTQKDRSSSLLKRCTRSEQN